VIRDVSSFGQYVVVVVVQGLSVDSKEIRYTCMVVKQPVLNINSPNTMHGESAKIIIEESENQLPEKNLKVGNP